MKQIIFTVLFLGLIVTECSAQWENDYFPNPAAFGVHDNFFFASVSAGLSGTGYLYRIEPNQAEADSGMHLQNGVSVTAFGSIASYFLAAVNTGTGAGGAYRSSNDGLIWIPTHAPQTNCFLTLDSLTFSGGGGGVYFSADSGMYWSDLSNSPHGVNALATVGDTLFAGTSSGVFVSSDEGNHWQATSMESPVAALAAVGRFVFAGSYGRVYVSKNGGTSWIIDTVSTAWIKAITTDGKNVFAGTYGQGVFLSADSGNTWDTINYGLPQNTPTGADDYLSVNALGVFDTLLFVGVWDGAGTDNRTYFRSIPEILRQKGDTTASIVSEPVIAGDSIAVYPNPALGVVTIRSGGTSILGVRVLNVLGEDMLDVSTRRESNVMLDLSKLPSGTYFLQIETSNGIILRKVIRE